MQPNKYDLMFVCVGKNGPLRYIGKCVARRFIAVDGVSTEQDLSKLQWNVRHTNQILFIERKEKKSHSHFRRRYHWNGCVRRHFVVPIPNLF